jgi:hypothetical protein
LFDFSTECEYSAGNSWGFANLPCRDKMLVLKFSSTSRFVLASRYLGGFMQTCPKCAKQYPDESKICRVCGSILDDFTKPKVKRTAAPEPEEEPILMVEAVGEPPQEETPPAYGPADDLGIWVCPQCQKSVPGNFEVCWNCFTDKEGRIDLEYSESAAADLAEVVMAEAIAPSRDDRACGKCGSTKIVRGARVADRGEHSDGSLQVVIYGDPEALLFKDRLYGKLSADICGQCGHVEFRVENPAALYEHSRKSRR